MTRTGGRRPYLGSPWGRLPLVAKILLPIFAMTVIASVGSAAFFTVQGVDQDRVARAAEGRTVALVVQGQLDATREAEDPTSLGDFLRRVSNAYPDVAAICVLQANSVDPLGPLVVYAMHDPKDICDPDSPLTPGLGIQGNPSLTRSTAVGQVEETAIAAGLPGIGQGVVIEVLVRLTPVAALAGSTFSKSAGAGLLLAILQTTMVYLVLWFSALRPLERLRLAASAAAAAARPSVRAMEPASGPRGDEIQDLSLRFDEMLAAVRDRERQLVASHAELETLISNAPVVAFAASVDGKLLQLRGTGTENVVQKLGYQRLQDVTLLQFAGPNPELARLLSRACSGEKVHEVVSVRHWLGQGTPGELVHLDLIIKPTFDSEHRLTDITGLAINVSDRVDAASARAESQQKSAFLAAMSHELRTPLNSIMGFSQLLDMPGVKPALTSKQKRYVGHIFSSGSHLLSLVGDILDLAKVGAGQLSVELEAVTLQDLVMEPVERARAQAAEKGVAIDVFLPPELIAYTDPERAHQMLFNLLSNAVKFTPEGGGTILVSGRSVRGGVEIAVADSGIGIAAEDQEKIFEEFSQVDHGPTRSLDGTGLGLTLTRRLAVLLGGQVRVESSLGVGSTFTIWLPGMAAPDGALEPVSATATY